MNAIAYYRKKAGLTQAELADLADLGCHSRICNYEIGRREPSVAVLKAIRDALRTRRIKVTLEQLSEPAE